MWIKRMTTMVTASLLHLSLPNLRSLSNLSSLRRLQILLGQLCSLEEINAGGRPTLPTLTGANILDHSSRNNNPVPLQNRHPLSQWLQSQTLRTPKMGIHQQTQTSRPASANLPTTLRRRVTCQWPLGQAPVSMTIQIPYLKR